MICKLFVFRRDSFSLRGKIETIVINYIFDFWFSQTAMTICRDRACTCGERTRFWALRCNITANSERRPSKRQRTTWTWRSTCGTLVPSRTCCTHCTFISTPCRPDRHQVILVRWDFFFFFLISPASPFFLVAANGVSAGTSLLLVGFGLRHHPSEQIRFSLSCETFLRHVSGLIVFLTSPSSRSSRRKRGLSNGLFPIGSCSKTLSMRWTLFPPSTTGPAWIWYS